MGEVCTYQEEISYLSFQRLVDGRPDGALAAYGDGGELQLVYGKSSGCHGSQNGFFLIVE